MDRHRKTDGVFLRPPMTRFTYKVPGAGRRRGPMVAQGTHGDSTTTAGPRRRDATTATRARRPGGGAHAVAGGTPREARPSRGRGDGPPRQLTRMSIE
eukprot:gene12894-biopygen1821